MLRRESSQAMQSFLHLSQECSQQNQVDGFLWIANYQGKGAQDCEKVGKVFHLIPRIAVSRRRFALYSMRFADLYAACSFFVASQASLNN